MPARRARDRTITGESPRCERGRRKPAERGVGALASHADDRAVIRRGQVWTSSSASRPQDLNRRQAEPRERSRSRADARDRSRCACRRRAGLELDPLVATDRELGDLFDRDDASPQVSAASETTIVDCAGGHATAHEDVRRCGIQSRGSPHAHSARSGSRARRAAASACESSSARGTHRARRRRGPRVSTACPSSMRRSTSGFRVVDAAAASATGA